jgi:flagellar protein FlgJ
MLMFFAIRKNYGFKAFSVSCLLLLLLANNAVASGSGNTQLLRNPTLEAANIDRALVAANKKGSLKSADGTKLTDDKIIQKSKELEAVLLSVMLEPMFPEGKESNLYGGHEGAGVFRTLMVQEYGKILSNAGGIGIAKGVTKQLRRQSNALIN